MLHLICITKKFMTGLCWYTRINTDQLIGCNRFNYRRSLQEEEIGRNMCDIFLDCIRSHIGKGFRRLRAGIEFDSNVTAENRQKCIQLLQQVAPQCEVHQVRPSNTAEWVAEMSEVMSFFGDSYPVLFHYNHDHFYVGPHIDVFLTEQICSLLSSTNAIIPSTDHPLWMCNTDPFYVKHTYSGYKGQPMLLPGDPGIGGNDWVVHNSTWGLTEKLGWGYQGEIICTASTMQLVWSMLNKHNSHLPYLPRPDWPNASVVEPPLKTLFLLPPGEICTHYDGYGYVTSMTRFVSPLSCNDGNWYYLSALEQPSGNLLITSDDLHEFRRQYYILLSRTYSICISSSNNRHAALAAFHEQIQRIAAQWAVRKCKRDLRFIQTRLGTDRSLTLESIILKLKASLLQDIDAAMPILATDMYDGLGM